MRACKYVWSCVYDIHTSTRIQKGIILDSGHGLVTVPPWALQFALYFGVGTNCLVLGDEITEGLRDNAVRVLKQLVDQLCNIVHQLGELLCAFSPTLNHKVDQLVDDSTS